MSGFKYRWSVAKSAELKRTRGMSFEDILSGKIVAVRKHPTRPHQGILYVLLDDYIWAAPFVPDDDGVFLKTLFRSRKHTKLWRKGGLT